MRRAELAAYWWSPSPALFRAVGWPALTLPRPLIAVEVRRATLVGWTPIRVPYRRPPGGAPKLWRADSFPAVLSRLKLAVMDRWPGARRRRQLGRRGAPQGSASWRRFSPAPHSAADGCRGSQAPPAQSPSPSQAEVEAVRPERSRRRRRPTPRLPLGAHCRLQMARPPTAAGLATLLEGGCSLRRRPVMIK